MRFTSAEFWIGPLGVLITITMILPMMILYILTIYSEDDKFSVGPPWSMMQGSLFHAVLRLLTFANRELVFYDENRDDIDGDWIKVS